MRTQLHQIFQMFPGSAPLRPKHSVVLASLSHGGYAAFDFVPEAAEDPMVALQLLLGALRVTTGGRVPYNRSSTEKPWLIMCIHLMCFFMCFSYTMLFFSVTSNNYKNKC